MRSHLHQQSIFPSAPIASIGGYSVDGARALDRAGGVYKDGYITEKEEAELLEHIDDGDWLLDLERRVQHYGYRYDYQARQIDKGMRIGGLPSWAKSLAERVGDDFFNGKTPDQMIVNEYEPGQGIAPHVDRESCFGPVVVSISLAFDCVMNFQRREKNCGGDDRVADGDERGDRFELLLRRRSVIVLKGESRYGWKHGIPRRKSDEINGEKRPRKRRVSLTFRTMKNIDKSHAGGGNQPGGLIG